MARIGEGKEVEAPELDTGGDETDTATEPEAEAAPEPSGLEPPRAPSRREKMEAERKETARRIAEIEEGRKKDREEFLAQQSQSQQLIAQMRGQLDGMRPFVERIGAPAAAPAGPTPAQLRREAQAALASGDMDTYHDKIVAEAEARMAPQIQQQRAPQQQQQQPGPDPMVQGMVMGYVQSGKIPYAKLQQFTALADIKDRELHVLGHQPSYERFAKAFDLAAAQLGGSGTPQFSQSSAAALSGVRGGSSASTSGGEEVPKLSEAESHVARAAGMTAKEYAAYAKLNTPRTSR